MPSTATLIAGLEERGLKLWMESGRVRYAAPAGVVTEEVLSLLRGKKAEIAQILMQRRAESAMYAPATLQQRWLWRTLELGDRWNPLLYTIALRIRGDFNSSVMCQCVTALLSRHPVLRTRLVMRQGSLRQEMAPVSAGAFECVSIQEADAASRERRARHWVKTYFNAITCPEASPLCAVKLLCLGDSDHILAVALHHLISDDQSLSLLFRELWWLYLGHRGGQHVEIRPETLGYADYARWQSQSSSGWMEQHQAYWEESLEQAKPLRLPGAVSESSVANELIFTIEESLAARVRTFCRENRCLVAMTLFASYVAVIARWCGVRDLLIPFDTSGRHLPEHDEMIGFFSYYLYVRLRVCAEDSFAVLLRRVTDSCYEALRHEDYTRGLDQRPDLLANPSFNWVSLAPDEVSGMPAPEVRARIGEAFTVEPLSFERTPQTIEAPNADYFGVVLHDTGTSFRATVCCTSALASTARRFMEDYTCSIELFITHPDRTVMPG